MTSLSQNLFDLIREPDFDCKIKRGHDLQKASLQKLEPLSQESLEQLKTPGRPQSFQIVSPRGVPKRNFQDVKNRIHFLHAIANIELLAIELPALSLLRFGCNDLDFLHTQLKIISEEAYHFSLLKNRLKEIGAQFGNMPVHHGLWDYAWKCQSELEHQILIPCYLEARGLDVSPDFIKKFKEVSDFESAQIMEIILRDEIGHVKAGQDYLKKKAQAMELSASELFEKTLVHFLGKRVRSKVPINHKIRKEAGFNDQMLSLLSSS